MDQELNYELFLERLGVDNYLVAPQKKTIYLRSEDLIKVAAHFGRAADTKGFYEHGWSWVTDFWAAGMEKKVEKAQGRLFRRLNALKAQERLFHRLNALKDGTPDTECLVETLKSVLDRYVFIASYVAVNYSPPDWVELVNELLSAEYSWPEDTDPDVLALFEARKAAETDEGAER